MTCGSKTCTKCGIKHAATPEFFGPDKRRKDGLQSQCRECDKERDKKYRRTTYSKSYHKKYRSVYCKTITGYLRQVYHSAKRRCNNPKDKGYKNYGGRGIKMKFRLPDELIDYVIDILSYNSFEKIKGLHIDRIDNDGHYEKGNIRFVTRKENNNNKRSRE